MKVVSLISIESFERKGSSHDMQLGSAKNVIFRLFVIPLCQCHMRALPHPNLRLFGVILLDFWTMNNIIEMVVVVGDMRPISRHTGAKVLHI